MSLLDDIQDRGEQQNARRATKRHPDGWEPGVEWDGSEGKLTVQTSGKPVWDDLLKEWGFDPASFEVVEPVQFRTWDANMGGGDVKRFVYYRATIRRRVDGRVELDALLTEVRKWKPVKLANKVSDITQSALIVPWADWQIGADDAGGPKATLGRFTDSLGQIQDRWRDLRKLGVPLGRLVVCGLGDLGEACSGFYNQQTYRVQLNSRDQRVLVRRMIVQALKEWSPLAPEVLVAAVGGNHGEERLNGQSYTDFADNRDVAVFEDVAEILRENEERFGHVRFMLPNRDLTLTVDVYGSIVALAHGHQIQKASGASPAKKAEAWWEGQMTARAPVGDADLLLTGHFHHLVLQSVGPRWHIQMPALHGGSEWFDNVRGGKNPPGQVSLVVSGDGWDHLKVH